MESQSAKEADRHMQPHCVVCGSTLGTGNLCKNCLDRGISLQQYAELFWEEA